MEYRAYLKSIVGPLEIVADDKNILAINFVKRVAKNNHNTLTRQCVVELKEYFKGQRKIFNLPIKLSGTLWQESVWLSLSQIPYGGIISYADLAAMSANPRAARAVGNAVNKNKVPIIMPCHRVLASGGAWGGYAGGLSKKRALLALEKSFD